MRKAVLAVTCGWAFACFLGQPAAAEEWVLGIGVDDAVDTQRDEALAFLAEYHSDPFSTFGRSSLMWMAAVMVDTDGDILGVGGVYFVTRRRNSPWVIEASLGAGGLRQGSDPLKEGDTFQFRSSIGAGYELSNGARISLSVDHLFDKEFKNQRPGTETVLLRYTRSF